MATLYVNGATGNDATSKASNSAVAPWATIGRAAWGDDTRSTPDTDEAADAGDTVIIAAGSYPSALVATGGVEERWDVLYNPVNEGTAGNPIIFEADGEVIITAPDWGGPVIGSNSQDYITWRGSFMINEADILVVPDTGPVILLGCTGVTIDGIFVDGTGGPWWSSTDNHNGIRLEFATACTIKNNTISGIYGLGETSSEDVCGILTYDSHSNVIEHNTIFDCSAGIFIKGQHGATKPHDNIVRFNRIDDVVVHGIEIWFSKDARVYQNVITNVGQHGIWIKSGTDTPTSFSEDDWVFNNTVAHWGTVGGGGVRFSGGLIVGCRFWNNIIYDGTSVISNDGNNLGDVADANLEHNCYFSFVRQVSDPINGNIATFATYRTTYSDQDDDAVESINADPVFVNAASDYRLQAGSPARDIGYAIYDVGGPDGTTIPAGAYITGNEVIGVDDEASVGGGSVQAVLAAVLL